LLYFYKRIFIEVVGVGGFHFFPGIIPGTFYNGNTKAQVFSVSTLACFNNNRVLAELV
jgi:hypothetical protein